MLAMLYQRTKQSLLAFLQEGSQHSADPSLQRKAVQLNIGVLMMQATVLAFTLFFFALGNEGLILSGLVQIPWSLATLVAVNRAQHAGHLNLARWFLMLGVMADAASALMLAQGLVIGIHFYYLLFAIVPTVFFPASRWRESLLQSVLNLGLFAFFEIHGWTPHPAMLNLGPETVHVLRVAMVISCVLIVAFLMIQAEYSAVKKEAELQLMASTDLLTQLPNLRAFRQNYSREVARARREDSPLIVGMLDVDHFKRINDVYGHPVGDHVLRLLAQVLSEQLRASDLVARVGGEEFALLMPQTELEQAQQICERLRITVSRHRFGTVSQPLAISISIGLARLEPGDDEERVLRAADKALYQAKNEGRNRVVLHRAGLA
ncbi:diguanylate cyclase (GGDEF)-like protein [Paucibacter oligotrophus]|uniref:diguanylate cyclase n=1 Tax=Roseateles oligotrophus TaxID=1769250 RepID=A0A840L789_9BURK|nr:GGDEF domain-containing protein [Roseateles oligotrophus]MBB4842515.1 diguanylate cyclase (GGDEF)-like protein [Roseateles oligotrophus]